MDWDAIGAVGEIVGAAAVVASLMYLAVQTRSNAQAVRASTLWDAETLFGSINYDHGQNPQMADLLSRALHPNATESAFSETELNQLHFVIRGVLQFMQAQWSVHKEGTLSKELWDRRKRWTCGLVSLPLIKPIWEAESAQLLVSPEFKIEIETSFHDSEVRVTGGMHAKELEV